MKLLMLEVIAWTYKGHPCPKEDMLVTDGCRLKENVQSSPIIQSQSTNRYIEQKRQLQSTSICITLRKIKIKQQQQKSPVGHVHILIDSSKQLQRSLCSVTAADRIRCACINLTGRPLAKLLKPTMVMESELMTVNCAKLTLLRNLPMINAGVLNINQVVFTLPKDVALARRKLGS